MNLKARVVGGFVLLCTLFLALVFLQLVVSDRMQADRLERSLRIERMLNANRAVLQFMTDAETGVRGFQLTGDRAYLPPYENGRRQAFLALDELAASVTDPQIERLVETERRAVAHWLYAYGIPIVNAGQADADVERAARGRTWFDDVRTSNAAVDAAVDAERTEVYAADRRSARTAELMFAALALLVLLTGLAIALLHERHLIRPIEHVRHTLRRLADGDLSARAVPSGPGELRAVMSTLNDLAAEVERLITEEQARAAVGERRQQVAAALRSERDPHEIGRRVAGLIAEGLAADTVLGRVTLGPGAQLVVTWPERELSLDPETVAEIRAGRTGVARPVAGGLGVALSGDEDCPPGLLYLARAGRPDFTEDERSLLGKLCREIDHAARQMRLRMRQERLISELRALDEQKDAFIATVTHELRTPLTSILGYTEMLTEGAGGELTAMQRRSLSAILRNAHRLRDTVADLLLLGRGSRPDGGESVPVDLAALLTALHAETSGTARAKDVDSEVTAEPAWVRGDGTQIELMLRKLVENAIKFTPAGGRFALRLAAEGPNAVLTVTDTGMGIPADDLPGLFTPFHRAANAMDQAVQGPGLGLAIVRTIVTEHGGLVTASSELGRGSTFTVTLPAIPAPEPAVAPALS
ncbi:ATP-binding protein [Paractinoplanes rishiriensis]|uniref:Sensor-like histidine kinase SenX3 n=1 Tax=Paractinoplanes rishiriensis TaxID=1050105 RepID=A0A919N0F1_9ACTN|nr:ATP-binding protein [Actinoplanes rishiriensis]GIE95017.1 hypothetical protein Ari01nite_24820 [Actinoplanes rishiriensis]